MNIEEKYRLVTIAQGFSYSPYSKFKVGALLIFNDDSYVMGCNIENASYPLGNCAERTAIFKALSDGKDLKNVKELVVIAPSPRAVSPCGACRQVMNELLPSDCIITLFNNKKEVLVLKNSDLLPYAFNEGDLNG